MSTRTTFRPAQVIVAGAMASNLTSQATVLQSLTLVNYSVTWSGTSPVGTLAVQASNDCTVAANGTVSGGTWNNLPLDLNGATVTTIPISGNTGNGMIDIVGLSAYAVRIIYTAGSGTGSLTATVNGKVG